MALIFDTTMSPTKLELLAGWLPGQAWFSGDADALAPAGAYRFDDPDGEVGMEGHLVTAGEDAVYHVPLTYRGAPLEDGEAFLLGTSDHGVLGQRWIYDAMGDPVYRTVLANTIAQGGSEAEEFTPDASGEPQPREILTRVTGSGNPGAPVPELWAAEVSNEGSITRATTGFATLTVLRRIGGSGLAAGAALTLRGSWPGQPEPSVLAVLQASEAD